MKRDDANAMTPITRTASVPPAEIVKLQIKQAREAEQRRDWMEALQSWEIVRQKAPDHVSAYVGAAKTLRQLGRIDEAEKFLGDAVDRFPQDERIARLHASLANVRRDWPVALQRWISLISRFPGNAHAYGGAIVAIRGVARSDHAAVALSLADTAVSRAREDGLDPAVANELELEIARALCDWERVKQLAEYVVAANATPSAQALLALAQANWHLKAIGQADQAAERALLADPTLVDALLVRAWVATEKADAEAALAYYRRLDEINPGTLRWSAKIVQLLNWLGRIDESLKERARMRERWPDNPTARALAEQADTVESNTEPKFGAQFGEIAAKAPDARERIRPLVVFDPRKDVQIATVEGAQCTLLIFTGANDGLSMPLPIFDRYLAALQLNAVYLKDFKRLRFLHGIQSLGSTYQAMLVGLRAIIEQLGTPRFCVLGTCTGAFSAIRCGVELGAEHILAFGPPTQPVDETHEGMDEGRRFLARRLKENVSADVQDLKPFLEGGVGGSRIDLFFDEDDPLGREHAMHVSEVAGLTLRPQAELKGFERLSRFMMAERNPCGSLAQLLGIEHAPVG